MASLCVLIVALWLAPRKGGRYEYLGRMAEKGQGGARGEKESGACCEAKRSEMLELRASSRSRIFAEIPLLHQGEIKAHAERLREDDRRRMVRELGRGRAVIRFHLPIVPPKATSQGAGKRIVIVRGKPRLFNFTGTKEEQYHLSMVLVYTLTHSLTP